MSESMWELRYKMTPNCPEVMQEWDKKNEEMGVSIKA